MKASAWAGLAIALAWTSAGWAQPPLPPPVVITNPDWLRKPTANDMVAVYPIKAMKAGESGRAIIKCVVTTTGLLRACGVVTEDPPGDGFGIAAVVLSRTFLMKPRLANGIPVEGEISIPISFKSYGGRDTSNRSSSGTVTVLGNPAWAKAPTVTEILAELGKKVGDRFADGQVVLQCAVDRKTGRLNDCAIANFSPGMTEFRGAARSLTSKFQIAPETLAAVKNEVRVSLAFSFPDMSSAVWSGRYLARTDWTRTPTFTPTQKTFPDEAAKVGLKTGSATVDCVVGADGGLSRCTTVSESTPGVGFGPGLPPRGDPVSMLVHGAW